MAAPADQILIVLLSGVLGYGSKWAQDWWTAKKAREKEAEALWSLHKQQFHLPLLDAGRQLEARLSELADIYRGSSPRHRPEGLSGDFPVPCLRRGWSIFTSAAVGRVWTRPIVRAWTS
jgi:hypothetical protein